MENDSRSHPPESDPESDPADLKKALTVVQSLDSALTERDNELVLIWTEALC